VTHIKKIKPKQVAGEGFDTDLLLEGFGFLFNIQNLKLVHCTVQGVFLFEKNVPVMN